jgi:hypothetical protein
VDCYWNVKVQASGNRLELNGILPSAADRVDFGDLIPITPDTGQPDSSTVAQFQATQQYVSNQVGHIDSVAASVFAQVATVQAQISTAAEQQQQAATVLALVQTAQAAIDADVTAVITAATQAALDRTAVAADRAAAETAQQSAAAAQTATEAARDTIDAITAFYATSIDGNTDADAAAAEDRRELDFHERGAPRGELGIESDTSKWKVGDGSTAWNSLAYQPSNAGITAAINAAVTNLVNGAPGALDQLNELAAALGNDANFAATSRTPSR